MCGHSCPGKRLIVLNLLFWQFVNFTQIMSKNVPQTRKETEFALAALMEIPLQYRATLELGLLGYNCVNYCLISMPLLLPFLFVFAYFRVD